MEYLAILFGKKFTTEDFSDDGYVKIYFFKFFGKIYCYKIKK